MELSAKFQLKNLQLELNAQVRESQSNTSVDGLVIIQCNMYQTLSQ